MDLDSILDALADALELERELGVRTVDIDRSLLTPPAPAAALPPVAQVAPVQRVPAEGHDGRERRERQKPGVEFVFVHDKPLSPKGDEMMSKIVAAMGKTAQTSPVVVEAPVPAAPIVVVLGSRALKKFFPGLRGSPGQWLKATDGRDVLVVRSPDEMLRFGEVTPAVKKMKWEMWQSLKTVVQRARQ